MLDDYLSKIKKELDDIYKDVNSIDTNNITENEINRILSLSDRFINVLSSNQISGEDVISSLDNLDSIRNKN
jgi:TnpA family transposase